MCVLETYNSFLISSSALYHRHSKESACSANGAQRLALLLNQVVTAVYFQREILNPSLMSLIVKVHFICQLDRATVCPGIWLNIILGMSVRVFPEEISI